MKSFLKGSIGELLYKRENLLFLAMVISSLVIATFSVVYFDLASSFIDGLFRVIGIAFVLWLVTGFLISDWKSLIFYIFFVCLLIFFAFFFPNLSYTIGLIYQYSIYIFLAIAVVVIISMAIIDRKKE